MAVGTVSSAGVGSNLDVAGIITKLMAIERGPLTRLTDKKNGYQDKISALGKIKSSLSSLQSTLSGLKSGSSFQTNSVASSNSAIVNATTAGGAIAGNYSIEVSQLAQSQKLVAVGQADTTTTAFGVGTLTIDLGTIADPGATFNPVTGTYGAATTFTPNAGGSHNIVIDSTNNSLAGIRDAINAANIGVSATIVNDGSTTNPYRLALSSTSSGANQSIRIAVTGDVSLSNLLSHDPAGTQHLSEKITAQNANFSVDGIAITKSSNTVTDVISGVTLNLVGKTSGSPVTLSVVQDKDSIKNSIAAFVKSYNDLYQEIKTQTGSGASAGALASDSVTRQMLSSIRDELNKTVTGITGSYNTLSSIGVSFQQDGTLALNETTLATALQADSTNVANVFSATDGYATRIDSLVTSMLAFNGTIASRTDGYNQRIKSLDDQSVNMTSQLARTEQRLRKQFTALDVAISQMSVTSNYLTQQLAAISGSSSR